MGDLLPGFRFYPTEEELVSFYLQNKLNGSRSDLDRVIPVVDIYDFNPWDLPRFAGELCGEDGEQWFFFVRRQEREARGGRPNRLTADGYWKATGSPGDVYSSQNCVIGRKRTMVFYVGRAPSGNKTIWKMNEYKAIECDQASSSSAAANPQYLREELSLCRIYKRSRSCLRAFDRRPPSEELRDDQVAVHHQHHGNEATTYQRDPMVVLETPESSPPGGHAPNPSHSLENMATESELFWDSEQFNWFDV